MDYCTPKHQSQEALIKHLGLLSILQGSPGEASLKTCETIVQTKFPGKCVNLRHSLKDK